MDIPPDAQTVVGTDDAGGGSTVVLSADTANPVTILTIDHLNEGGGTSLLACDGTILSFVPFDWIFSKVGVRYVCTEDVTLTANGAGASSGVSVTYVPYNLASVSGGVVNTQQPWHLVRTWTLGDVGVVAVLMPIAAIVLWMAIRKAFVKPVRYHK